MLSRKRIALVSLLSVLSVFLLLQCASPSGDASADRLESEKPVSDNVPNIPSESEGQGKTADKVVESGSPQFLLNILVQAYPDRVSALEIRDGDWSVLVGDTVIYWAGGRLLSDSERPNREDYSPYQFYSYPAELPDLEELKPADIQNLKLDVEKRESHKDLRSADFMTALWGMDDFLRAENTVVSMEFLGFHIRIHPDIINELKQVEAAILRAAENDAETAQWLESLSSAGAYVWRDIAGSANRSLHSYGLAIDLIPADYSGKQAYWRWASDFYDEWWRIPYEDRFHVPDTVVKAFESNGFIWGGKWLLFDQIHFEYRPELILPAREN